MSACAELASPRNDRDPQSSSRLPRVAPPLVSRLILKGRPAFNRILFPGGSEWEGAASARLEPGVERLPHALAGQRVAQRLVVAGGGAHRQELLRARGDIGHAPTVAARPGARGGATRLS